jgi:excisionase family DNA binding protein
VAEGSTLMTVAEVAERLRVSTMTVYRLIQRDELEALRIGRSYRIAEESLADYLRATVASNVRTRGQS